MSANENARALKSMSARSFTLQFAPLESAALSRRTPDSGLWLVPIFYSTATLEVLARAAESGEKSLSLVRPSRIGRTSRHS
jgi:hypothetical protein